MKAILVREFGEPEVMKIEELPKAEPGAGQVLVHIEAAGVNPVDTYIRTGTHAQKPDLPYTPGKDAAGTIEAVGEGAVKFPPGEPGLHRRFDYGYLCRVCLVHRGPGPSAA